MERIAVEWELGSAILLICHQTMEGDRKIPAAPSNGVVDGVQKIRALHG